MENSITEYKREFTTELNKEIIAFANTAGGKIYIGVDDNGKAVDLLNIDDVMQACVNHIRNTIKPDITMFVKISSVKKDDKEILEVEVEKGTARPYYISGKGIKPEGVYVRVGSSSVPATESAILKMITETYGESYEEIRSLNQDLTFQETEKYFQKKNIVFGDSQKKTLGFINEDGLFTNLALLFSEQCEHTIKVAVFDGTEIEVFKDRYEFSGSLLKQLNDVFSYIDRYNRTQSTFQGLERNDKRDYPIEAIRETLLNCIIHREYSLSGSTLIHIFDDRMEFISLGGLVKGIEYDDMMLGVSLSRNKKIASVFYRLQLIEAYGTGISKIMRSYNSEAEKPFIEVTANAFKITLPNAKMLKGVAIDEDKVDVILKLFDSKKQITRSDVEKSLNVSYATAARVLAKMVESKLIMRVGNTRNTKYVKI